MKLVLQITAGILLAIAITIAGCNYAANQAVQDLEHQAAAELAAQNAAARDRAAKAKLAVERARAEALAADIAAEQQRNLDEGYKRLREAQWLAAYKAPPECEHPADDDWSLHVECGNHYMRAKAEWERKNPKP